MTPRRKAVDLEQMLAECETRFEEDNHYLRDIVYAGLKDRDRYQPKPMTRHLRGRATDALPLPNW